MAPHAASNQYLAVPTKLRQNMALVWRAKRQVNRPWLGAAACTLSPDSVHGGRGIPSNGVIDERLDRFGGATLHHFLDKGIKSAAMADAFDECVSNMDASSRGVIICKGERETVVDPSIPWLNHGSKAEGGDCKRGSGSGTVGKQSMKYTETVVYLHIQSKLKTMINIGT